MAKGTWTISEIWEFWGARKTASNFFARYKSFYVVGERSLTSRMCQHTTDNFSTNFLVKMAVFWVVAPCGLVAVFGRFRDACCFRNQGGRPDDMTQHARRQTPSYSPMWETEMLPIRCCSCHSSATPRRCMSQFFFISLSSDTNMASYNVRSWKCLLWWIFASFIQVNFV
jgi:hypothetical protein